jgi:hypothetical protein
MVVDLLIILQLLKVLVAMVNRFSIHQLYNILLTTVHFGVLINVQAFAILIRLDQKGVQLSDLYALLVSMLHSMTVVFNVHLENTRWVSGKLHV